MTSVPARMKLLGELYEQRNAIYGDNYKHFGKVLKGMFPRGIVLATEEEFNRFALFIQIMHKTTRLAQSMPNSAHADSCDDLAVYTQMLAEYDDDLNSFVR